MDLLVVTGCAVLGLVVGSFLNVVASRVPAGQSVVRPISRCPGCQGAILPQDNIPVLSWLLLGRRCRHCRMAIPVRYPLVEASTAVIFALVGWQFGLSWETPAFLVLAAASVALSTTDLEQHVLPAPIVLISLAAVTLLVVLATAINAQWGNLALVALGAVNTWLLFRLASIFGPEQADTRMVRLGPLLGAPLGFLGIEPLVVGLLTHTVLLSVVTLIPAATKEHPPGEAPPIAPLLCGATFVVALVFAGT